MSHLILDALKIRLKKLVCWISVAAMLLAGFSAGIWQWQKIQNDDKDWDNLVQSFNRCDLSSANRALGWATPFDALNDLYIRRHHSLDAYEQKYIWLLSDVLGGSFDLNEIWLDPAVKGSLGKVRTTPTSINLLSRCKSLIANGDNGLWLEIGKYYLGQKHENSMSWLNQAGEAGVADAYVLLGHAYRIGALNPIKDERLALTYYLKAARAGSTKGQFYASEVLKSVNRKQAYAYLVAAAEGGSLAAAYKLQDMLTALERRHSENPSQNVSDGEAYFWNLVFFYLRDAEVKKPYWRDRKSGRLGESPEEYEFDGFPQKPRDAVRRYDIESARQTQKSYESKLSVAVRVVIQAEATKWISSRKPIQLESPPLSLTTATTKPQKMPVWKSLPLAVCGGVKSNRTFTGVELYKNFSPFIWTITSSDNSDGGGTLGTAIAVAPKLLVTNCHVISNPENIKLSKDKQSHVGRLVAADVEKDKCIIEVATPLNHASSTLPLAELDVGTPAYTLGNPQGLTLTLSNGIISGIRKSQGKEFIQTTAPISKGSSGGALLDDRGNLLGITTFYLQGGQAMNFAIPIEQFCKGI